MQPGIAIPGVHNIDVTVDGQPAPRGVVGQRPGEIDLLVTGTRLRDLDRTPHGHVAAKIPAAVEVEDRVRRSQVGHNGAANAGVGRSRVDRHDARTGDPTGPVVESQVAGQAEPFHRDLADSAAQVERQAVGRREADGLRGADGRPKGDRGVLPPFEDHVRARPIDRDLDIVDVGRRERQGPGGIQQRQVSDRRQQSPAFKDLGGRHRSGASPRCLLLATQPSPPVPLENHRCTLCRVRESRTAGLGSQGCLPWGVFQGLDQRLEALRKLPATTWMGRPLAGHFLRAGPESRTSKRNLAPALDEWTPFRFGPEPPCEPLPGHRERSGGTNQNSHRSRCGRFPQCCRNFPWWESDSAWRANSVCKTASAPRPGFEPF